MIVGNKKRNRARVSQFDRYRSIGGRRKVNRAITEKKGDFDGLELKLQKLPGEGLYVM